MKIRVGDTVEVMTGDDRGQRGKVLKVDHQSGRVVVEGVNRVYKHVRRSQRNPQGGRLAREMPVHVSNVKLICSSTGKASRVGVRTLDDGSKERFCKVSGAAAGVVSPPKTRRGK